MDFADVDAIKVLLTALEPLEESARHRVLRYVCDKYEFGVANVKSRGKSFDHLDDESSSSSESAGPSYETSGELLAYSGASSDMDKALVIGYWFQVIQNHSEIESQAINTELKHIGYGVGNITRAFDGLVNQRPQPVIQLRKGGASQQARKKFKLTDVGIKRVEQMLASERAANGT